MSILYKHNRIIWNHTGNIMRTQILLFSILACVIAITAYADTNMLFDFENGQSAPVEWGREWGLTAYISNSGVHVFSGTNAMNFHIGQGKSGVGPPVDWSAKLVIFSNKIAAIDRANYFTGYTNVGLYLHEETYSANKIRVRLYEDIVGTNGGLPYKEVWYKEYPIPNNTDYQRFDFVLKSIYADPSGFARDGDIKQPTNGVGVWALNLANIETIAIIINKDTVEAKSPYWNSYHVDDIQLWNPTIFIPPATNELFTFEHGASDVNAWQAWHEGESTTKQETDVAEYVAQGNYAMEITYDQSMDDPPETNYWKRYAAISSSPYWTNWNAFNTISYEVREQAFSTNYSHIVVYESNGEKWEQSIGHLVTSSYETVFVQLTNDSANGFTRVEYDLSIPPGEKGNNNTLDKEIISSVEMKFDKGSYASKSPQYVHYYIDAIMLTNKTWWTAPANGVLDDFEYGATWTPWDATSNITTVTHVVIPEYVHNGNGAMCIRYNQSLPAPEEGYEDDYWRRYATATTIPYWTNWDGYTGISYWLRSAHDDTNQIHFVMEESSGQIWQQSHMITATTGWQQVKSYFQVDREHGFTIYQWGHEDDPKGTNMLIDLEAITNVFFRIDKGQYGSKAPPNTPISTLMNSPF